MATTMTPSGADFNAVFEAGNGMRGGGVSDRLRDRLVREEHTRLHRQGWEPATVASLLPFPLTVNLGDLGLIGVPAATPENPVSRLVISDYRISMRDLGDGNFTPVAVLPSELAKEVKREYAQTGGVFWYSGTDSPVESALAEARAKMSAWWRTLYEQAVDSWEHYRQHSLITDRMRDAARELFAAGEIAALPEWITVTRAQADRRDCSMCGESIKATARLCHFCRTEIAPEPEGK